MTAAHAVLLVAWIFLFIACIPLPAPAAPPDGRPRWVPPWFYIGVMLWCLSEVIGGGIFR